MTPIASAVESTASAPARSFELVLGLGERSLGTFVGREREVALVRERMAQVQAGRGQLVGIRGEPGVGKSRFLYEISQDLAKAQVAYLAGRCFSYASAVPYVPILDIVRQQLGLTERDTPATTAQKISAALAATGLDADEQAPWLLHFLGVKSGADGTSALGPDVIRSRALEALRQLTLRTSQRQPVVLVIEDLHWIDRSSEEYLLFLLEALAGAAVLVLASFRPDYRPGWGEQPWAAEIALERLSREASLAVVRSARRGDPLSEEYTKAILDRAEGHPLFLEELAAVIDKAGDAATMSVPETIHAVLAARIDHLDATEQQLLRSAAVLGKDVPVNLLRDVTDVPKVAFATGLKELERAGLLYLLKAGSDEQYTFKHSLTQEAAYERLPPDERRALHARVVAAVEARYGDSLIDRAELLAHHSVMATDWDKAVHYLHEAGHKNVRRSAHAEAIAHLTRALELLPLLPETPERAEQEIALLLALGVPLAATLGYSAPEVQHAYARARELCGTVDRPVLSFPAVYGLWRFYLLRAEYLTARELGKQLLGIAERTNEATFLVQAHRAVGATSFYMGELSAARAHCDEISTLVELPERRAQVLARDVVDPWVTAGSYKAWTLWLLGRPDEARREIDAALALARALKHPFSIALALSFASWLHQFCGDAPRTRAYTEEALGLSIEHNFRFWLGWGRIMQAWTGLEFEAAGGAAELMREGLAQWEATGSRLGRTYFLALLSEAYRSRGDADAVAKTLSEAQAFAMSNQERFWEAELYRLQGELHLSAARDAEAEACFRRGLDVSRRQGALSLELRVAMSLGRLWLRQGKRSDAHRHVAGVVARFSEGSDTGDLKAARALLELAN